MNLFERLFSSQVAEAGVWVEEAGQTIVWPWGLHKGRKGRVRPDGVPLGSLRACF